MNARTLWAGIVIASCTGCGGTTFVDDHSTDGGANDSATSDGSVDDSDISETSTHDSMPPLVPGCPASTPSAGAACATEGIQCEYGDAWWNVACDVVMQCTGGQWQSAQLSFEPCSPEPGTNPASCPATSTSIAQGAECAPSNTNCYYPDAFCQCDIPLGPVEIDGGTANWTCLPGDGCPYPRPPLGSSCTSNNVVCNYENCSYGQMCVDGAWQGEEEGCATLGSP